MGKFFVLLFQEKEKTFDFIWDKNQRSAQGGTAKYYCS